MSYKPSGQHEPRLEREQLYRYLPSIGADFSGTGEGPAWSTGTNVTVSHPTPSSTTHELSHRRTRFTSTANANLHLGLFLADASAFSLHRGDQTGDIGGFYFQARFMINAIPNTSVRFFCGLSAQVGTGVACSSTIPNNTMGLWVDTGFSGEFYFIAQGTTPQVPTKLHPTVPVVMTAGILYEFTMIQNPNQNTVVTRLMDISSDTGNAVDGVSLRTANFAGGSDPVKTAMMGPQIGLGNAANAAGGDTSLDVVTLYVRPNMQRHPWD